MNLPTLEKALVMFLRQWLRRRELTVDTITREDLRELLEKYT